MLPLQCTFYITSVTIYSHNAIVDSIGVHELFSPDTTVNMSELTSVNNAAPY